MSTTVRRRLAAVMPTLLGLLAVALLMAMIPRRAPEPPPQLRTDATEVSRPPVGN